MDPVTLTVIAGAGIGTAAACVYLEKRKTLKKGDICIHEEANRERAVERSESKANLEHGLHPHDLQYLDTGPPFGCDACTHYGVGNRYSCERCDFVLHQACAKSIDVLSLEINAKITSFVHEHPLNLVTGKSPFTCKHCNNESNQIYRFNCAECNLKFDLMCTTNPTRLLSFLHHNMNSSLKQGNTSRNVRYVENAKGAQVLGCTDVRIVNSTCTQFVPLCVNTLATLCTVTIIFWCLQRFQPTNLSFALLAASIAQIGVICVLFAKTCIFIRTAFLMVPAVQKVMDLEDNLLEKLGK